jgi:hypothetical protein
MELHTMKQADFNSEERHTTLNMRMFNINNAKCGATDKGTPTLHSSKQWNWENMKTPRTSDQLTYRRSFCPATCLLLLFLCLSNSYASTLVSGNVSGTWTTNGSPYVAIDNCNVPSGQVLTIKAGVTVIIGQNVNFDVNGQILAVGTSTQHIQIKGPSETNCYNRLLVYYGGGGESVFKFCDFSNAARALFLRIYQTSDTMSAEVSNSTFRNCTDSAIYGESEGWAGWTSPISYVNLFPRLNPTINNCRFSSCVYGGNFNIWGHWASYGMGGASGNGSASPSLKNCIFENISGVALVGTVGSYAAASSPVIANSLFFNCGNALQVADPFDANMRNCIVVGCTVGIQRSGSLSSQVAYNCFFNNGSSFVGYPTSYLQIVLANGNGTPCDVAFNILQNPQFVDATNYYLSATSPCVDAGDPSGGYDDCLRGIPFSLGTAVDDMGPYGGPDACAWITTPIISGQPVSASGCLGQGATLSVAANGTQLCYQWWFNGMPLAGQTNKTLVLTDLQLTNAGSYWVVVSNNSGSVTSAPPAQLTVYDACIDLHMYAGLNMSGQQGSSYVLSYSTDLSNTNGWVPMATNTMGASGWFYLDMDSPFSPHRFYKATLR